MIAGLAGAVNILPNPSFEVWLDTLGVNMPMGWLTSELLHPGSALKDTNCNTGNYCLRLVGGDTIAFATSLTIVRTGFSYEFAGYANVVGILGGSFVLEFLSLLGNPVGSPQLIPVYFSNGYRRYSRWITAPDSAVFLSVSCICLPEAEVYFDDVTVDDTTVTGIEERSKEVFPPRTLKKLIVFGRQRINPKQDAVFDVSGRVMRSGRLSDGVYFLY